MNQDWSDGIILLEAGFESQHVVAGEQGSAAAPKHTLSCFNLIVRMLLCFCLPPTSRLFFLPPVNHFSFPNHLPLQPSSLPLSLSSHLLLSRLPAQMQPSSHMMGVSL